MHLHLMHIVHVLTMLGSGSVGNLGGVLCTGAVPAGFAAVGSTLQPLRWARWGCRQCGRVGHAESEGRVVVRTAETSKPAAAQCLLTRAPIGCILMAGARATQAGGLDVLLCSAAEAGEPGTPLSPPPPSAKRRQHGLAC